MTARCPHNDRDRMICHACYRAGVRPNLSLPEPPRRPVRDVLIFLVERYQRVPAEVREAALANERRTRRERGLAA
jgi:hypothetical protein